MSVVTTVKYVVTNIAEYSGKVHATRNKNRFLVACDMLGCLLGRHVYPFEYHQLGFDSIPRKLRDTYVTTHRMEEVNRVLNDKASENLLTNKFYAGTVLAPYYKRPCIQNRNLTLADFKAFAEGQKKFIYKPIDGYGGEGHRVYRMDGSRSTEEIYEEILSAPRGVLEGWIVQHEALNALYAGAVHTIRLHTLHDGSGENIEVFGGNISIAFDGELANTHYSATICAQVDDETGILVTDGLQRDTDTIMETIPTTGVRLKGYQLPDWQETLELVRQAAAAIPEIRFIGWDVAFSEDGPVICEGNIYPGVVNYQHYAWYASGHAQGAWTRIRPYVEKAKKK